MAVVGVELRPRVLLGQGGLSCRASSSRRASAARYSIAPWSCAPAAHACRAASGAFATTAASSPAATAWCTIRAGSDPVAVAQRREHPRVQLRSARSRQRPLHGAAGQLVPEGHRVRPHLQHPALLGLRGSRRRRALRAQGHSTRGRHHGEQLQRGLGRPGHPRGPAPARRRDGGGHAVGPAASTSVTKNGLPPVSAYRRSRVARAAGEPGDGRPRQRASSAGAPRRPPSPPSTPVQRMVAAQFVVAVGEHQQRRQLARAAGEEAQHVERGVVGPVHVLDDSTVAGPRQLARCTASARRPVSPGPAPRPAGRRAAGVVQRAERARGEQVVAGAREHPHRPGDPAGERPHHAGLADARLARTAARPSRCPAAASARQVRSRLAPGRAPAAPAPSVIVHPPCGNTRGDLPARIRRP